MLDSSGRRALRANGTVLDLLPIGQAVAITGALLVALFVVSKPEASSGLGIAGRIAFWGLHVGLGLIALYLSSRWLASGERIPNSTWTAVLVSGCAAIVIASPGYLALDALFNAYVNNLDVELEPAANSLLASLFGEMLDLAPWFLIAWLLINLPVLLPRPKLSLLLDNVVHPTKNARKHTISVSADEPSDHTQARQRVEQTHSGDALPPKTDGIGDRFLSSLPGVVGTDVIAVASDLHYLNVWTVAGRTTVLGNLKDVIAELEHVGMQVHRSHWVAHAHVRRIVGTASNAACILSNELRVPISRRRWKAVREQYGRGVVNTAEEVTHADDR